MVDELELCCYKQDLQCVVEWPLSSYWVREDDRPRFKYCFASDGVAVQRPTLFADAVEHI